MQMDTIKILIVVSICCDIVLFILIAWLFFKIKAFGPKKLQLLIEELKESQKLVQRLQAILDEKARLVKSLEARLDTTSSPDNQDLSLNKKQVIMLYKSGMDTAQIAKETGLTTGEVELILSLSNVSK